MKNLIHFNREERFFTGTVFPSIVCRENFKHFHILLGALKQLNAAVPEDLSVEWTENSKTILFYSEYSLKKSGHKFRKEEDLTIPGDTPDILFIIKSDADKYLFALEGKMFLKCNSKAMMEQLQRQSVILKSLAHDAGIKENNIFHFGLVPGPMAESFPKELSEQMLTWEKLYSCYSVLLKNDYFGDMLKYALDNYFDLRGETSNNSDGKLPGARILAEYKERGIKRVGRYRGVKGDQFKNDVENGSWLKQEYEYGLDENIPNGNWFSINDFLEAIYP